MLQGAIRRDHHRAHHTAAQLLQLQPVLRPSKVIAGGGSGTWMFTGYIIYLVVGVVAVAVTAIIILLP